ncbi:MAG: RNA pyrophosphohydrolase [Rubellimicrobium sp.]|nr:RNA pyrophosphohydrolase [Rubellimicrobium sp.]
MTPAEISRLPYRPSVGIMLANRAGRVFTGQRRDRYREAWQMPQGGIEPGEDAATAALRELGEETGIAERLVRIEAMTARPLTYDLPPEAIPGFWGGRYRGQAQTWVLMRFLGADADIDIATAEPEFSVWRWSALDDLAADVVAFKRRVYEQVVAELGPRAARGAP